MISSVFRCLFLTFLAVSSSSSLTEARHHNPTAHSLRVLEKKVEFLLRDLSHLNPELFSDSPVPAAYSDPEAIEIDLREPEAEFFEAESAEADESLYALVSRGGSRSRSPSRSPSPEPEPTLRLGSGSQSAYVEAFHARAIGVTGIISAHGPPYTVYLANKIAAPGSTAHGQLVREKGKNKKDYAGFSIKFKNGAASFSWNSDTLNKQFTDTKVLPDELQRALSTHLRIGSDVSVS